MQMDKTDHGLAGCGSMRYCCGACDLQMERHCLRSFMWPVIAAGAGFVVAGVGFFSTEGKSEILYGICAAACLFCMIVQTAMAV